MKRPIVIAVIVSLLVLAFSSFAFAGRKKARSMKDNRNYRCEQYHYKQAKELDIINNPAEFDESLLEDPTVRMIRLLFENPGLAKSKKAFILFYLFNLAKDAGNPYGDAQDVKDSLSREFEELMKQM